MLAQAAEAMEAPVIPAPCSTHDDRLRELERHSVDHSAQLRAGSEMFVNIQARMNEMHSDMKDAMGRIETAVGHVSGKVDSLVDQVADLRVKQATQGQKVEVIEAKHAEEEAEASERKKAIIHAGFSVLKWAAVIILSGVATKYGITWLADVLKSISGG